MGDSLQAGKPSQYVTSHLVNSAFHPYGVGKLSTGLWLGLRRDVFTYVGLGGNTV